ncbi:carotenoid oxygenase family protein [Caballeronia sp. dw_19]|uniref:carotenoid oxygenase family protein n=1 Tax=Caballeronia sp. dw_19 TaxID=2719791 RepID=UPI001BD249C1|nr:carotenoid oxygenase family protein [Caballeronia sp. dw_19]
MTKDRLSRRAFLSVGVGMMAAGSPGTSPAFAATSDAGGEPPVGTPWRSNNPALSGAFEPVFDERDDADLQVQGEIPAGLNGVFMRNGPNPRFEPDARYAYPFDGTGMIHAIFLQDGRARYRNRWVATDELCAEQRAGHRLYNSTFSPPPHPNLANTNIVHHGGRYLALYEGGKPYELDSGIGTLGRFDYQGKLPGVMSAHPKTDPLTGELLSVSYELSSGMLTYVRANRSGQIDRVVPFQAPWAAIVHDVALTHKYLVVFVCPFVFDWSRQGPPGSWEPERGVKVALIPRDALHPEQIRWIDAPPFFHWHTINAFADGDRIEAVLPWYDCFSLTGHSRRLELHRLVIDIARGVVHDQAIDDQPCEFGRVNDAYLGQRARYGYVGLRMPRPGEKPQIGAFEAIARYDLVTGSKTVHQFAPGLTVSEPVFVADPHGRREEDGFIVTFVHELGSSAGRFVILDARQLDREPLAVIELPRRVPAGLHGAWIPASLA